MKRGEYIENGPSRTLEKKKRVIRKYRNPLSNLIPTASSFSSSTDQQLLLLLLRLFFIFLFSIFLSCFLRSIFTSSSFIIQHKTCELLGFKTRKDEEIKKRRALTSFFSHST